MKRKGTARMISFSVQNLDLCDFVDEYVEKENTTFSAVCMLALRKFKDDQISTREILRVLIDKVDNLSAGSVFIKQAKEEIEEVEEIVFNLPDEW